MGNRTAGARGALALATLLVSFFFISTTAQAETPTKGKGGVQMQSFGANGKITSGMMFGLRTQRYIERSQLNLGLEFMAGSPRGGRLDRDNLTYGGITMGYDGTFGTIFSYDFSCFGGYGFGRIDELGMAGSSFTVQPTVGVGLTLIDGYRATFAVGYLYMPAANGFNAFTFGVRLEQKSDNYSSGINY